MTQLSLRVLDSWLVPGILVPRGQILGRMDLGGDRSEPGFFRIPGARECHVP
jgi:hypothetical protein